MKWISELELTRGEKAVLVAVSCFVETDIAPTMDNIGNFSIEFAKEALKQFEVINLLFSLDLESQDEAANLIKRIFNA